MTSALTESSQQAVSILGPRPLSRTSQPELEQKLVHARVGSRPAGHRLRSSRREFQAGRIQEAQSLGSESPASLKGFREMVNEARK